MIIMNKRKAIIISILLILIGVCLGTILTYFFCNWEVAEHTITMDIVMDTTDTKGWEIVGDTVIINDFWEEKEIDFKYK